MGANGPPAPQPEDHRNPADLATRLDDVTARLRADYQDAIRPWPDTSDDERVVTYWRSQTENVMQDIDLVQHLADLCHHVTAGHPEPEPLADLDDSLIEARIAVQAALRAFQARDEAGQFTSQSRHYFEAARQLRDLARYCPPLAAHLRGLRGLSDASE